MLKQWLRDVTARYTPMDRARPYNLHKDASDRISYASQQRHQNTYYRLSLLRIVMAEKSPLSLINTGEKGQRAEDLTLKLDVCSAPAESLNNDSRLESVVRKTTMLKG